ncbi:DNA repair protein REV1-like [Mercenaria mercenaria]|uniref:DNA repair protein REV1-like n=1 Tax=Mercenaria mercenaria TaxID=6596 RepID=UPI00234EC523|nr:DNA repair protein REV1-like [Mercenaria mercenaria]
MSSRGHSTRSRSREDGSGWDVWGGYMNAKKQKLQQQFVEEAPGQLKKEGSGSKIFSGISIHVNGYTKPSSDELKRLMMLHGGSYEHYLYRTRVTHVIATNLPNSKVKELKGLKVVRPEWITESIAAGKLLSYTKYLLYTAQSGLQKGLQTYTIPRQNSNQSEGSFQSIDSIRSDTSISSAIGHQSINKTDSTFSDMKGSDVIGDIQDSNDLKENKSVRKPVISPGKTADARDPKFLSEFYNNSRLHYLSTWKAEWKNYVNELQSKGDHFPGREQLRKVVLERAVTPDEDGISGGRRGKPSRCVMHIDMDCFFVSVGLRKRPDLRGKPVAVTHSKGKGSVPDPESDLNFERQQWELKKLQSGRKGRKGGGQQNISVIDADLSFPDQSDSDDDVTDDVSVVTMATTESFHSMAEIASCSYEARQAGVRNGMFMGRAKSICPDIVTIPYDFEGYKEVSKTLYDTVASYTHDIEAVSCDEMLVDCTDVLADTGATPLEFATLLRSELFDKTGCPASAGLASSILLARMATRKAKPNGQFLLTEDLVMDYMKSQPIKDLPGVGWSTTKRFEAMKVVTCGDLQRVSLDTLQKEFGPKTGQSLYRYCRGQDDRPIKMEQQRKSVSAEVNYGIRFTSEAEAVKFMEELSEEVCNRLKNIKMKGKTVTLKLMVRREDAPKQTSKFMGHGICNNFSKSVTLPMATDDSRIVAKETIGLLRSHKVDAGDLRGIGIQVQKLESADIGCHGTNKKLPSILNYTVNTVARSSDQTLTSDRAFTGGPTRLADSKSPGTVAIEYKEDKQCRKDNTIHNETCTGTETLTGKFNGMRNGETGNSCENNGETIHGSMDTSAGGTDLEKQSEGLCGLTVDKDDQTRLVVPRDLLEDIGRRQAQDLSLPPLPCLPDIKTPESGKKSAPYLTGEITDPSDLDYFPSPSQVDPEVLRELPIEIRDQIEKELKQRRKKPSSKSNATSELSAAGCSHWQRESRNNMEQVQNEADKHSQDAIVPLPSPSQIDPSCLEALPESLQAELRQAYARQDSELKTKAGNTLQLKQAKSPSKSPNKRSPGKGSPNFKVPRGRPSGRGRKKGSSKKTLFRDQTSTLQQQSTDHQNVPDNLSCSKQATEMGTCAIDDVRASSDVQYSSVITIDRVPVDKIDCPDSGPQDSVASKTVKNCVNLCGAITLQDVRRLLREWITSTPVPQQEDEDVLQRYMVDLVTDRNLEQVDLLFKFMLRNINESKGTDWLHSLKRIFTHTQAAVYELYGSRLVSITL